MSEKPNQFLATWADMGLDYSDWQTDPIAFSKRIAMKAKELAAELDRPNTIANNEEQFKSKALANAEAAAIAEEFIQEMMGRMLEFEPEVIANILVRMADVTKTGHAVIRNMALRRNRQFSKKRTHAMYVKLRKMYETYVEFQKYFNPELKGFPIIPAKSGNYATDTATLGVKEYIFQLDEEEYLNYYTVARILGIEINHYMDLVDFFNENPTYNGRKLTLHDVSH